MGIDHCSAESATMYGLLCQGETDEKGNQNKGLILIGTYHLAGSDGATAYLAVAVTT